MYQLVVDTLMLSYKQPENLSGIQQYAFINPHDCRLGWGESADLDWAYLGVALLHMSLILPLGPPVSLGMFFSWLMAEIQEHKPQ